MSSAWKNSIENQRIALHEMIVSPMERIASECVSVWGNRQALDSILSAGFPSLPHCTFLYALGPDGVQVSDNISIGGLLPEHFGRDRSKRPYMLEARPDIPFLLSDAYISLLANRPSITAIKSVWSNGAHLGFLGADFDLRDLPMTGQLYDESMQWLQIKGDPAIRRNLFQQERTESVLDRNLEQANSILTELLTARGMFQGVIHYSSSRATVWVIKDPYRYRILDHEALSDPDICLAYPLQPYPDQAVIPENCIAPILDTMSKLRVIDETIYLRSSSINTFNGMISLTFSCDGTHYMPYKEFLNKDYSFWVGSAA